MSFVNVELKLYNTKFSSDWQCLPFNPACNVTEPAIWHWSKYLPLQGRTEAEQYTIAKLISAQFCFSFFFNWNVYQGIGGGEAAE